MVVAYLDNYQSKKLTFQEIVEIPEQLKYFATIQHKNNVLLCGGMNTTFENPEDPLTDLVEVVHNKSFMFDIKKEIIETNSLMMTNRAKHCLCLVPDIQDKFNTLVLAIGGISIDNNRNLFLKKNKQQYLDLDSVEYYSFKEKTWQNYNAKLSIARHCASACFFKDYVYVIGGHTVKNQSKFINTIERCHKKMQRSYFEHFNIKQNTINLYIQNQLCVPLNEDNGILILTSQLEDPSQNNGYFLDIKQKEIKNSAFDFQVGPINHWHNSYDRYDERINFLTEQLQVLRFETKTCSWTLFELPKDKSKNKQKSTKDKEKMKDVQMSHFQRKTRSISLNSQSSGSRSPSSSMKSDSNMSRYSVMDDGSHIYRQEQFYNNRY